MSKAFTFLKRALEARNISAPEPALSLQREAPGWNRPPAGVALVLGLTLHVALASQTPAAA